MSWCLGIFSLANCELDLHRKGTVIYFVIGNSVPTRFNAGTMYGIRPADSLYAINEIIPSVQQCGPPASARRQLPHPSPDLPAMPVLQSPSRSREVLPRTLCVLEETRREDCDGGAGCLGKLRSSSETRLRRGKGTGKERGRGSLGRAKRGWIGGSGMREVGKGGRWWTRWRGYRCEVGRSWTLSLMTPMRRTGEGVCVRMRFGETG